MKRRPRLRLTPRLQAEAKAGEAEAALSAAQRVKAEKDQDAAPVLAAMETKAKEAKEAALAVRKAEVALATAKDAAETADRRVKKAATEEAVAKAAADAKAQAEAKVGEAEAALSAAQRIKAEKDQDAASALKTYNGAAGTTKAAADVAKFWNRRLFPLSIFVSRKTQRLYIRQGHDSVFDAPVTIRDPEKPLGTHVYVAMPPLTDAQGSASSVALAGADHRRTQARTVRNPEGIGAGILTMMTRRRPLYRLRPLRKRWTGSRWPLKSGRRFRKCSGLAVL